MSEFDRYCHDCRECIGNFTKERYCYRCKRKRETIPKPKTCDQCNTYFESNGSYKRHKCLSKVGNY